MKIKVPGFLRKKESSLGFWERFPAVFTPNFLDRLEKEKEDGKSWGFWFLSNLFLVLIPFIVISVGACILLSAFPDNAVEKIPADASIEIADGSTHNVKEMVENFSFAINENFELETANVPDPLMFYVVDTEEEGNNLVFVDSVEELNEGADFVFVLDTKERNTDIESIGNFKNAFYLLHDRLVTTDQGDANIETVRFVDSIGGDSDAVFPMTLDLETIANSSSIIKSIVFTIIGVLFVLAYLFFAVFRLVSALFWALLFWVVGIIAKIKDWSFEKSFMAMLHYSFVTMLLCPLGMILGLSPFWSAAIMLGVLFGMNFYHMKKA